MACLVHPTGWRLYHRRLWKNTYYLDKKYFPLLNLKSKVIHEILNSTLSGINYNLRHKTLFSLIGFNVTMASQRNIQIYIHFKLYWRTAFTEFSVGIHKFNIESLKFLNKPWGPTHRQKNYWVTKNFGKINNTKSTLIVDKLVDQRILYWKKKNWYSKKKKLSPLLLRIFESPNYYLFFKKFFIYFTLIPYFYQLKNYFLKSIKTQINTNNFKLSIFFLAPIHFFFNPMDILRLVKFMILKKGFSPTKTLYLIIKIMMRFTRKYNLRGFKFLLAGRFTRRGRSIYKWRTFGGVNLGSKYSSVEFYTLPIQGFYSKCITKLWICRA